MSRLQTSDNAQRTLFLASSIFTACLISVAAVEAGQTDTSGVEANNDILANPADSASTKNVLANTLTPRGALLRSAVLPGWGQTRNGHYTKAALFSTAAVGFLVASAVETRNLGEANKTEHETVAGRRNTCLLLFFTTVTFAALDAYVDTHLANVGVSASTRIDRRRTDLSLFLPLH